MTSIAVWAGVDSRGPASLYIAADSRITFNGAYWDQGRKVSTMSKPHIFGYWGSVDFPALALPLIVDRIDRGLLATDDQNGHADIYGAVRRLWNGYPSGQRFSIVHGQRTEDKMASRFSLHVMTYKNGSWSTRSLPMASTSALLLAEGSGKEHVRRAYGEWQAGKSANTSRAVFGAFCDAIAVGDDSSTGGAPQLVGLYRVGSGQIFGIVHNNQRYFAGAALTGQEQTAGVQWRNRLFEITDGARKKRASGAKVHERC